MKILQNLEESINLARLKGASEDKVKNAFFSNYLAALVLLRLQDIKGLMLINDPSHSKLTKFSSSMSDINFWGRALFYSNDHEVKNRMQFGHGEALAVDSGRVSTERIQKITKVPLTNPATVDWTDATAALILLRHRFDVKSSYYDKITRSLFRWDMIGKSGQQKAVNDAFMYVMQSDPQSALLSRLRGLANSIMINAADKISQTIIGFKKLHEDGEGGGDGGGNAIVSGTCTGNVSSSSCSASSGPDLGTQLGGLYKLSKLSPTQVTSTKNGKFTVRAGKLIKKKVKAFKVVKFKAPDFMKINKEQNHESK